VGTQLATCKNKDEGSAYEISEIRPKFGIRKLDYAFSDKTNHHAKRYV
jgi:hypothetical protein